MRTFSIYFSYFTRFLQARLEYKADFITSILANIAVTVSGLLFILILLDGSTVPSISGWTKDEVLFIYGYSMISMSIFSAVASNLYSFAERYIIEGQFDRILLRPLSSASQVLFESFNLECIGSLSVGLFLIGYSAGALGIAFSPLDYLWLAVSGISGGVILISVFVSLASLSFHFEDRLGIGAPVYSLINFSRYPMPIFNRPIQFILRWVVPFSFTAFYPATHFLKREGRDGFEFYCYLTPFMAVLVVAATTRIWNSGVRRYTSTGH